MGTKRKVQKAKIHGKEDNACPETTTREAKPCPDTDDHGSNAKEAMNVENLDPPSSKDLLPKKADPTVTNVVTRRSDRLKRSALPNQSQNTEPTVEHVNLDENEKEEAADDQKVSTNSPVQSERNMEEEAPHAEQLDTEPDVNERNLKEKVECIVRKADEFKSKVTRRPNEGSPTELNYKSLYFDSQKTIEALMEKHYELVRKLEYANGKIDAYEKMNKAMVGASKEVIVVSRKDKGGEAPSLSPQTVQACISAAADEDDQNATPKKHNDNRPSIDAADGPQVSLKQKKDSNRKRKAKS